MWCWVDILNIHSKKQMLFSAINNIFWCTHNWSCGFFLALTTCKKVSLWGQRLHSWSTVLMDSSYFDYVPQKIIQCLYENQCNVYESTNEDNLRNIHLHNPFENELNCFNFDHVLLQYIRQYNSVEPASLTALFISRSELLLFSVSSELLVFLAQQFWGKEGVQGERGHHYLCGMKGY